MTLDAIRKFLPLETPLAEIEQKFPGHKKVHWLVESAQFAPGGVLSLGDRAELGFAVDEQERVFFITTSFAGLSLPNSLHIGDSFSDARKAFPSEHLMERLGYGTALRIAPQTWLLFDDMIEPRNPGSKIVAVQIRNDSD